MTNTTSPDVARCEATEAAAWQSAWEATPDAVVEALAMSKDETESLTIFRALKAPSWFFNRILVRVGNPVPRAALDSELDRYVAAGVQHGVCVPPKSAPAELPQWLLERGLAQTSTLARMIRSTEGLPSTGAEAEIRQVGREEAAAFADTAVRGFGMPPICGEWFGRLASQDGWRTYVAFADGKPVGTGALFLDKGVGWLGFGCTLPGYRKRGLHRAMLARRMTDAADLGCRHLQTETNLAVADEPTPSLDNMRGLGFEMAYARPNYVFTPPAT